jgi:hypothetical protein
MPEVQKKPSNYYHLKVRIISKLNGYVREFCYLDSMPDKSEKDICRMKDLRLVIPELLSVLKVTCNP